VAWWLVAALATVGCKGPFTNNIPPAERVMEPGPGVGGPGPGVIAPMVPPGMGCPAPTSQIAFVGPDGMHIQWDIAQPGAFDSPPLVAPGRYNFPQAAIYRLKLSNITGRPGIELYPTIEVAPTLPRSAAFLAHNAIPVQFTEEDFDQVLSGNFVTKVVYLPDPEFQELALAGVETLVSTRLDPGVDPIVEADRRGAIMAVVRLGNKDLEAPGADAQSQGGMGFCPMPGGGPAPMGFVAGVNAPQYGMPMSGTPIGLAGPPHVPLGIQAGMYRYTIANHTHEVIPAPTSHVRVDVKQEPGFHYPAPANHVRIVDRDEAGITTFHNRESVAHVDAPAPAGAPCPVPAQ